MKSLQRKHFDQINTNIVLIQNWRNAVITEYANKGYNVMDIIKFIDEELLPNIKHRYLTSYLNYASEFTPSIKKDKIISSLNIHMEDRFK